MYFSNEIVQRHVFVIANYDCVDRIKNNVLGILDPLSLLNFVGTKFHILPFEELRLKKKLFFVAES